MKECPICREVIECEKSEILVELDEYLRVGDLFWCPSCQTYHLFGMPRVRTKAGFIRAPRVLNYADIQPDGDCLQVVVAITMENL